MCISFEGLNGRLLNPCVFGVPTLMSAEASPSIAVFWARGRKRANKENEQ